MLIMCKLGGRSNALTSWKLANPGMVCGDHRGVVPTLLEAVHTLYLLPLWHNKFTAW